MASLWQQWGRAGRGKGESLGIFVAGNDALEQFFVSHPDELLDREVEAATIDFTNPYIHGRHLAAAAYEAPLTARRRPVLRRRAGRRGRHGVAEDGGLRRRNDSLVRHRRRLPGGRDRPALLVAGEQFTIVDEETGDIVGTEEAETGLSARCIRGPSTCTWATATSSPSSTSTRRVALVRRFFDTYHTLPRKETDTGILAESRAERARSHRPPPGHDGGQPAG